jgi:N-acetylglucosaminyldiphosphoundecaprenol N-acetyl-beta-D-mannosaminyltransferase
MRQTVAILGIPVDILDTSQTLQRLEQFILSRRFHQIATANTDFLAKAMHDPELKHILQVADMVVADGMPLVMASRWLRVPLPERVTGADLVPRLAGMAAQKGYRLFMLGAKPEVAASAKARLESNYPGIQIVGCLSPPVGHVVTMDNETILRQIETARPDILLVAFGNPKQEKWIHMHRNRLQVPVCIGVGGTFDFLAGSVARAPVWMQRSGLEWLYRFRQEPRRLWRRYRDDILFFARYMTLQLWGMRGFRQGPSDLKEICREGDTIISVTGSLHAGALSALEKMTERALSRPSRLILDLSAATGVDSAVLGTLLLLPKRAAGAGQEVRLVVPEGRIQKRLRYAQAHDSLPLYDTLEEAQKAETKGLRACVEMQKTRPILILQGRADVASLPVLESSLQKIPNTSQRLDVDMREISYLECAILARLFRHAARMRADGRQLRLIPGEVTGRMLEREGIAALFQQADAPGSNLRSPEVMPTEAPTGR